MADDRIRRDQDDLDLDEGIVQDDGGELAEMPDAAADLDDEDLDDEA